MGPRPGGVVRLLGSGGERDSGRSLAMRSVRRWPGCGSRFQYVRSPVIDERGRGGQALVGHGRVGNEHDVVLSPSDCGQKVGEIAVAGDEDYCGRCRVVLDERHDIHCAGYQSCSAICCMVETRLSSSSPPSSFHCADSLGREVSVGWRRRGGRTGERQATGLKFGSEGGLPWRRPVWELKVCLEEVDCPELVRQAANVVDEVIPGGIGGWLAVFCLGSAWESLAK
jgi:hypothetical protein